jgi:MFS family permease
LLARRATAWVFFANGAALGSWVPHIPDAKQALGLNDGLLGLALLGMAAGSLVGLPLSGLLTARFGSRRTTTAAILALLLATPLPLLAPSLAVAAALILLGIANGAVDVAMNTQAIAIEERFGRTIMSGFHGFFSAGGLAGAAVAGLAMEAGTGPVVHLTASVALVLLVTLCTVRLLLPTAPAAAKTAIFRLPQGALLELGVLALCSLLAEGAMSDWASVYLREDLGTGAGYAALGFAGFSLAMAAGRFLGDRVVRRYGGPAVLCTGAAIAAALLTAGLLAGAPSAAVAGFAGVGLGLANSVPILFSAAGKISGIWHELAIAAVSTAGYCGFLAGPPVIGLIAEQFGLTAGLGLVALALAIVALGSANITPERSERRWMVLSNGWR